MKVVPTSGFAASELDYRAGLSKRQEAVISSHFMDEIARNPLMQPYDQETFVKRSLAIDSSAVNQFLIPTLIKAARELARERAAASVERARGYFEAYGLADPDEVTEAEAIAEVMFDRQFSRKANLNRSRRSVRDDLARQLERCRTIELTIPALPFKIMSPLKARGTMPDFAEVGFILSLYEIAYAIETVSHEMVPEAEKLSARFVVVSDGMRFASIVNVASGVVQRYRRALEMWIQRLGVADHVMIEGYCDLLQQKLPAAMLEEKRELACAARHLYCDVLSPVLDLCAMEKTLAVSRALEPDPEEESAEGRFASLLKSLVYTVNYRALERLDISQSEKYSLYRELTSTLFEPLDPSLPIPGSDLKKESLRQAMLCEVWQATIEYIAEIKSDRDLECDPVLACLPWAIRWTIHAKAGQLAIMTPSVGGSIVQAWAGSALFRKTKKGTIRLSSYPVLGIEGQNAVPVVEVSDSGTHQQPLFYIDRKLDVVNIDSFVANLGDRLTRRRLK